MKIQDFVRRSRRKLNGVLFFLEWEVEQWVRGDLGTDEGTSRGLRAMCSACSTPLHRLTAVPLPRKRERLGVQSTLRLTAFLLPLAGEGARQGGRGGETGTVRRQGSTLPLRGCGRAMLEGRDVHVDQFVDDLPDVAVHDQAQPPGAFERHHRVDRGEDELA